MPSFAGRLSRREIAAIADFVSSSSGTRKGGRAVGFKPDETTLSECGTGDRRCYEQAFGNLANRRGPKVALERFERTIRTDPAVEADCHPIAHTIGGGALLHYRGNVGKAFAAGSVACGSGYYHGLLEWKLAGVSERDVVHVARGVCADPAIRVSAFNYYQCVHGLGHGLMLYTGYDLPGALGLCHGLATSFDQVSCTGGVFMENQTSSYGIRSKWLKADDLIYPCNFVAARDKLYCYLLVTSQILPRVGWDWDETTRWCRLSDRGWVSYCFQSYGRDASGQARQNPERIIVICRHAGDMERECIFGAVRDILNNDSSDLRARRLCESVPLKHRAYCFFGIGTILGTQHRGAEGKRRACSVFARGRDLSDCYRGATS